MSRYCNLRVHTLDPFMRDNFLEIDRALKLTQEEGDMTFNGDVYITGTLTVDGATALGSTLAVTGATSLSSTLAVAGATTLSSTLLVSGGTTLSSTLQVDGISTFNDNIAIGANYISYAGTDDGIAIDASNNVSIVTGTLSTINHCHFYTDYDVGPIKVYTGQVWLGKAVGGSVVAAMGWYTETGARFEFTALWVNVIAQRVGFNQALPTSAVEILDASLDQLRLTNTDATDYAGFNVDGNGLLTITTVDGGGAAGHINLVPDGSVGINQAAPLAKLEVLSTTTQLRLTYDNNANYATFAVDATGLLTVATVDADGSLAHINLNPDGNVGVKTAAPTYALQVTGTTYVSGATTLASSLDVTGNVQVNTSMFVVNGTNGYTTIAGKVIIGNSGTPQNWLNIHDTTVNSSTPGIDFFSSLTTAPAVYNSGRIYGKFWGVGAGGYTEGCTIIAYPTAANAFTDCLCVRNGRVGIGTLAPDQIIHGYTAGTNIEFWVESGAGRISGFKVDDSTSQTSFISSYRTGASYPMSFIFGAVIKMVLTTTGQLVINDSTLLSSATLEVNGTTFLRDKLCFTQTDLNEYIDSLNDGYIDYRATTGHRFGDGTNYAMFAADGELTLAGTARVEKENSIGLDGIGKGASAPTVTRLGDYYGYAFTIGDDGYASFEVPDEWDSTTAIDIAIHWYINEAYATNSGEVKWQVIYACTPENGAEAVDAPTHTGTLTTGDVNIPATAKYLVESIVTIPAASIAAHDVIGLLVSRVALTAGNNPTAEPVIVSMEYEFYASKLGYAT